MSKKCTECQAHGNAGMYGFDFDGITGNLIDLGAAFGGYVTAQTVDNTLTFLKDSPKTSGWVWTGLSLGLNMLFPEIAQNRYIQSATIGAGVYGLKRLNQHFNFLKGINGIVNNNVNGVDFGAEYSRRLQEAANRADENRKLPPATTQEMASTYPMVQFRTVA